MGPLILGLLGLFVLIMAGALVWRQRNRRPCPHCGLSVNPSDATCPYCHTSLR